MSMLHIVNKSPSQTRTLDSCLRVAQPGSAVLLIEDGVYAASGGNADASALHAACGRLQVFALQPDCDARGISSTIVEGVTLIDYGGFVDLVAQRTTTHSWL
ncbi:MAG: sulfurtransferase complex subunit TusB [Rhizobacter sp.]|nr:sulfurtransferase complex subunit TusB [Rhizobacter sp.]